MLFKLKKALMYRSIEKRNSQNPFDYSAAENYTLQGVTDPLVNNSYYFSAHDGNLSVFARLGRRVRADESWFAIFVDGRLYSLREEDFPSGGSPVKVNRDGDDWTLSFEGTLNENDAVRFCARFVGSEKPVNFSADMPAARMATALANEKWNRTLFTELRTISGQCHYEQEGVLEGEFTLGGESRSFRLPCVRDHSFGKRDWNYMNNHLWLMGVSPAVQLNYSLVSYPALSVLEVGNCRDADGQHYMMEADLDLRQVALGSIPSELSFRMRLDDGRSLPVRAKVLAGVSYRFQDGQYLLHENIAEFRVGEQTLRGILEIGFNSNPARYFNQRDLSRIVR